MNENKIDFVGRIQQSPGDFNSEFGNYFGQYFDVRQGLNMGTCGGGVEQPPYIGQARSSNNTIISRFESPASAFYATEIYMGFPQYDCQIGNGNVNGNPSLITQSKTRELDFPLYQNPGETIFLDSPNQSGPNFELSNPLQSQLNSDQCCGSPENSNKIPIGNFPGDNFLPIEQHKLFIDDAVSVYRSQSNASKGNQDNNMCSYNLPQTQIKFSSHQQDKLSPTLSAGSVSTITGNPASSGPVVSSKTRIRWTQDLHEKFVACVNSLGGAEKATPKAILRLMESDGLTIFHVKSHLQKYRTAKYMPEAAQGKSDNKRTHVENVHLDVKTGLQIREALQLQLDVQRRLHEQLEIQRKLQMRIEEQGKQLKMMFDQQQKSSNSLLSTRNLSNTDNNDKPISPKDVEVSISEGSGKSFFHSKIS